MSLLPILLDHNAQRVVGELEVREGKLVVKFIESITVTHATFFEIFGNAGVRLLKYEILKAEDGNTEDDVIRIKEAEIIEFSISPPTAFKHFYDPKTDTLKVEGIRFAGSMFRTFATGKIGSWMRIEQRKEGRLRIRQVGAVLNRTFDILAGATQGSDSE